jgi:hypothetical protein
MRVLPAMQGKNMALLFVFKKSTIIFFTAPPQNRKQTTTRHPGRAKRGGSPNLLPPCHHPKKKAAGMPAAPQKNIFKALFRQHFRNQPGGVFQQDGRVNLQAGCIDQLLAFLRVGALQAHDDGHLYLANVAVGVHHALRHAVAAYDAPEDVHQYGRHLGVAEDDAEGLLHTPGAGRAANIEEVGRVGPRQLDDVHGGHGQPRPVHHAAHVPVELHIAEVVLAGFHLNGVLFVYITHLFNVGVPEQGVVVDHHLGVGREDPVVGGLHHGVDLKEGGVAARIGGIQGPDKFHHLFEGLARQAKVEGDLAALESLQSRPGVDHFGKDLLRRFFGHGLYVHPAPRGVHDHGTAEVAVQEDAHVELLRIGFAGIIDVLLHQHLPDLFAFRPGLRGNELHAEDLPGVFLHLAERAGDLHTAALAAPACMDLRLYRKCFHARFR